MFVLDLGQTIKVIIVLIIVIICLLEIIIKSIIDFIKIKSGKYKNCFKCKNYKLEGVASAGDCCWYKCKYKDDNDTHSMNDWEYYCKCDKFEKEGE